MSSQLNNPKSGNGRELAPRFTLTGAGGETFSLDAQLGVKRTLLLFYPQDMTSG